MTKIHPMIGKPPARSSTQPPSAVRMGGSTGVVGYFGWTRTDPEGRPKQHFGVDLLCQFLDPIYAAHDGVIRRGGFQTDSSGQQTNRGYGSRVYLELGSTLTVYAHLALQLYQVGMAIRAGVCIGLAGRSGNISSEWEKNAEPTHLHWEVKEEGRPINPLWWLYGGDEPRDGMPRPEEV